jgi:hypothetical protein
VLVISACGASLGPEEEDHGSAQDNAPQRDIHAQPALIGDGYRLVSRSISWSIDRSSVVVRGNDCGCD